MANKLSFSLKEAAHNKAKWDYSLTDVIHALHGSMTGSGDGLADEAGHADFIRMRINEFGEPRDQYDAAIRHLALMLLLEWDRKQPTCLVCHGPRATREDWCRSKELPHDAEYPLPWEAALCWAAYDDGSHTIKAQP